jgi:hypothetical protein
MRKFEQFFRELAQLRADVRGNQGRWAKQLIGDSVRNNRTLTVAQAIRYLDTLGQDTLATQLDSIRPIIEQEVFKSRSNRTDAVDLSEFVNTYRNVIMNGRNLTLRRKVGVTLAKVG